MNTELDLYSILGVPTSATGDEIKIAYRRIARRLHPDANPSNPGAAKQFQDITVAYEVLGDVSRRSSYDREMRSRKEPSGYNATFQVTPSKRVLTVLPEPQVIYLLAELYPDPRAIEKKKHNETRLNLSLVLDQSNSMNGNRLEKVKVAAHQIIDSLSEKDILSVVTFNDRATVVIPATYVTDKTTLKAKISMMSASGGTEIFKGLDSGVRENHQYLGPKMVNHVILLTDGRTYGDQKECLQLAEDSAKHGIGISAMGLGNDWNDEFLDQLAAKTGGNSAYISTAGAVTKFLNEHVRNLSNAFAERVRLSIAPDPDCQLELAFKILPHPQPLELEQGELQLGSLQMNRPISVLMQLQMPGNMPVGFRSVTRLVARGDILDNQQQAFNAISDLSLEVTDQDVSMQDPPVAIMDALSKLTLYRLQERANDALDDGNIVEATRRLENLATRLLEMGHEELANQTLQEARRVAHTRGLSDGGRKTIKYQTRFLLANPQDKT